MEPWGQRVIRFYDPDMHIVEVGESLESVACMLHNEMKLIHFQRGNEYIYGK